MARGSYIDIRIIGIEGMRRDIRRSGGKWPKELSKAHRTIAKDVAGEAQKFAVGTGPMQAHFAKGIRGYATPYKATVGVRPEANAAFWGAKKRTGWYAASKYAGGPPQFPPWVGNSWDVGVLGQGPLAINPTIFHEMDNILDALSKAVTSVAGDIDGLSVEGATSGEGP